MNTTNMKFGLTLLCLFILRDCFCVKTLELSAPVETTPEEFPFQAAVLGRWTCSGALITENYVITPAHCLHESPEYVLVYMGFHRYPRYASNRKEENTEVLKSIDFIVHEEFRNITEKHFLNDIALIKLPEPVELSKKVSPGKFLSKWDISEGKFMNVSGWISDHDLNIQVETVQLLNQDTCSYLFGQDFLRSQEMCAKLASSTSLNLIGDIVTVNGKIIGLLARKHTCLNAKLTACKKVHVFHNLVPYLPWISQKVDVPIAELIGEDEEEDSDLSLTKVKSMIDSIKETQKELVKELANVNEKIEDIMDELRTSKNSSPGSKKFYVTHDD